MRTSLITLSLCSALLTTGISTSSMAFSHHKDGDRPQLFDQQDTNKDGKVSKEEALAHAQSRFDAIDANHDGVMTKEEIAAHREAKRKEHCK